MKEEFDVNLTPQDMYRFNMYHTYHGFHGILSIVMAILVIIVTIVTWGDLDATYSAIYLVLAALFCRIYPAQPLVSCKNAVAAFRSITEYTAFYGR